MWQDMKLYWAWRSLDKRDSEPPTKKRIIYEKKKCALTGEKSGKFVEWSEAVGVFDGGKYTVISL